MKAYIPNIINTNLGELLDDMWLIEAEREARGDTFINPADLIRLTEYIGDNTQFSYRVIN
jgi:hypothetical protein